MPISPVTGKETCAKTTVEHPLVWQKWQHLTSQMVRPSGTAGVGSGVVCQRSPSGERWPCPAEPRMGHLPLLHPWGHGGWASLVTVTWSAKHAPQLLLERSTRKRMYLDKPGSRRSTCARHGATQTNLTSKAARRERGAGRAQPDTGSRVWNTQRCCALSTRPCPH